MIGTIAQLPNYKLEQFRGTAKVDFKQEKDSPLFIKIETQRLLIRSVLPSDLDNYHTKLYGDPDVMGKVSYGRTKSLDEVNKRMNETWLKRWQENFPFSAMAIFTKDTNQFVGHVMLRDCKQPGVTEIHYLISKEQQRKGYGMEAASAVIYELLPQLVKNQFLMHGKPVEKIMGTTHFDNTGSINILQTLLQHDKDEEKYGALRKFYSMKVTSIK